MYLLLQFRIIQDLETSQILKAVFGVVGSLLNHAHLLQWLGILASVKFISKGLHFRVVLWHHVVLLGLILFLVHRSLLYFILVVGLVHYLAGLLAWHRIILHQRPGRGLLDINKLLRPPLVQNTIHSKSCLVVAGVLLAVLLLELQKLVVLMLNHLILVLLVHLGFGAHPIIPTFTRDVVWIHVKVGHAWYLILHWNVVDSPWVEAVGAALLLYIVVIVALLKERVATL